MKRHLVVAAMFGCGALAFTTSVHAQTDRIEQMRQEHHERVRKMREDSNRRFDAMRENSEQRLEAMRNGTAFNTDQKQERSSSGFRPRRSRRLIRWVIGLLIVGAIAAWKLLTKKNTTVVPIDFPKT